MLKSRFDQLPEEQAKRAIKLYNVLKTNQAKEEDISLLESYARRPNEELSKIVGDLETVMKIADNMKQKYGRGGKEQIAVNTELVNEVKNMLKEQLTRVTNLEVVK